MPYHAMLFVGVELESKQVTKTVTRYDTMTGKRYNHNIFTEEYYWPNTDIKWDSLPIKESMVCYGECDLHYGIVIAESSEVNATEECNLNLQSEIAKVNAEFNRLGLKVTAKTYILLKVS